MYIAYGGITAFVPLFANSIKVNSGAFFLAYAASLALSRPLSGKFSDRYGQTFVIVPALVITILALIVLSFSTGLLGMIISAVLYGIGFGSAQPALQAATIGSEVTKFTVGDHVGVGCFVDSCGQCEYCLRGEEQFCTKGVINSYNSLITMAI
jgi:sugar phosphate permease